MKCKNKEVIVRGTVYFDGLGRVNVQNLRCICTNDEKGKTLSIDNGAIQFSVPMEEIGEIFKGDYKK
jgi:hypothetical protein